MKNDEVCKPAFFRHSTFLVHYSIFLFGSGLSGLWSEAFRFFLLNLSLNLNLDKIKIACPHLAKMFF
jgi:hypothetical protein